MSEKVRGAIFNALGDIKGLTVLDAFAGTGAIAFEAVSRGAVSAIAIDIDKLAQRTITENIASLGLAERVTLIGSSARSWGRKNHDSFDIVVCDPPFNDMQLPVAEKLAACAKVGGIIIYSLPPSARLIMSDAYEPVLKKQYGDATLSFFRRLT